MPKKRQRSPSGYKKRGTRPITHKVLALVPLLRLMLQLLELTLKMFGVIK